MLISLEIRNFVLIDKLKIDFERGLSVLTGETGAGKSIIISALELLSGEKGSTRYVGNLADKLIVVGTFNLRQAHPNIFSLLPEGSHTGSTLSIRREITVDGRSRSYIGTVSVRVSTLKEISTYLIDIHGQHENQSLFNAKRHLEFYDSYIGATSIKEEFKNIYKKTLSLKKKHEEIEKNRDEITREKSLLEYAVEEIEKASLKQGEDDEIKNEINMLNNAEKIDETIASVSRAFKAGEMSVSTVLSKAVSSLEEISEYDNRLSEGAGDLEDIVYRLSDIESLLGEIRRDIRFNPERLDKLNGRLFEINSLKKKYGGSIQSVLSFYNEAKEKLSLLDFSEEDIHALKKEIEEATTLLSEKAKTLSDLRTNAKEDFSSKITEEIVKLGMKEAVFTVDMFLEEDEEGIVNINDTSYKATEEGIDNIEFMLSPNSGSIPGPLRKIASGGEISRVMLALKTALASGDPTLTMVFDEIDTGIGGRAAEIVGEKLKELGKKKQVFAITHLAQIAVHAASHFAVEKVTQNGRSLSAITRLSSDKRVYETARMLGGKQITETTKQHAREMLKMAGEETLF